jgi:hypothetical protein
VAAWSTLGFFEIEPLVRLMEMARGPSRFAVCQSEYLSESGGKLFVDSVVSLTAIRYFDNQALTIS